MKYSIKKLESSKKEKAVQRIFVQQTKCKDWEEAVEKFPNYSNKIKEFKGNSIQVLQSINFIL